MDIAELDVLLVLVLVEMEEVLTEEVPVEVLALVGTIVPVVVPVTVPVPEAGKALKLIGKLWE